MSDSGAEAQASLYNSAESATAGVTEKLSVELEKTPTLHFLMDHLGGFLYFAAQKLIDRKAKTGEERPRDEAVIASCSRLFNECFAGYLLARKGLVLQSIVLLRSAFEITSQAVLFMEREDLALAWLRGKQIPPKEVRRLSPFAAAQRQLYKKLSGLSHPNIEALRYHTVPFPSQTAMALAYGGWFMPKSAGQIATQFLFAQLVFLERFYTTFHVDLQAHGLLWRPETLEAFKNTTALDKFGWFEFLSGVRKMTTDLLGHYNALPNDALSMSLRLDDLSAAQSRSPEGDEPRPPE